MIEELNFLIRMIALGGGLMLLAQITAGAMRGDLKAPLIGMIVGMIASLLHSDGFTTSFNLIVPWVDLVALSVPFFGWHFGRNLFGKTPIHRVVLSVIAVLLLGWVMEHFLPFARIAGFFIVQVTCAALMLDLILIAASGRKTDKVEERRAVRVWLPFILAVLTLNTLVFGTVAIVLDTFAYSNIAQASHAALICVLMLLMGIGFLKENHELLLQQQALNPAEPESEHPQSDPPVS